RFLGSTPPRTWILPRRPFPRGRLRSVAGTPATSGATSLGPWHSLPNDVRQRCRAVTHSAGDRNRGIGPGGRASACRVRDLCGGSCGGAGRMGTAGGRQEGCGSFVDGTRLWVLVRPGSRAALLPVEQGTEADVAVCLLCRI